MENEIISENIIGKKRVLIISYDFVGQNMAGPGIRFYELSKILSAVCDVTLAVPNKIDIGTPGFRSFTYDLIITNPYKKPWNLQIPFLYRGIFFITSHISEISKER